MKTLENTKNNQQSKNSFSETEMGRSESPPEFSLSNGGGIGTSVVQMAREKGKEKKRPFKEGINKEKAREKREQNSLDIRRARRWETLKKKRGAFENAEAKIALSKEQEPEIFQEDDMDMASPDYEPPVFGIEPDVQPYFDAYKGKNLPLESKVKGEYFESATRKGYELDGKEHVDLNVFKPNCPGLDHLADTNQPFEQDKAHTSGDMDGMVRAYEQEIGSRGIHAAKFLEGLEDPGRQTYRGIMAALKHASENFENLQLIDEVIEEVEEIHQGNEDPNSLYEFLPHEDDELVEKIASNMSYSVPRDVWEEMGARTGDMDLDQKFFAEGETAEKEGSFDPESFLLKFNKENPEDDSDRPFDFAMPSEVTSFEINAAMDGMLEEGKIRKRRPRKEKTEQEKALEREGGDYVPDEEVAKEVKTSKKRRTRSSKK